MYTSYVVTILSSMCMDYVSLAWIYSIPLVMNGVTASDYHPTQKGCVATQMCGVICCIIWTNKMYIKIRIWKGSRNRQCKSKQTSNQLKSVKRNTHATSCIDCCYNSKPNAYTNKVFSSTSTKFNPYFGWCVFYIKTSDSELQGQEKACMCVFMLTRPLQWVIYMDGQFKFLKCYSSATITAIA